MTTGWLAPTFPLNGSPGRRNRRRRGGPFVSPAGGGGRRQLGSRPAPGRLPAAPRAAAGGAVTLLLVNASCPAVRPSVRPTVLLDGSLSMQAAGGRWSEALALARRAGDVRLIGPAPGDTTPDRKSTRLNSS